MTLNHPSRITNGRGNAANANMPFPNAYKSNIGAALLTTVALPVQAHSTCSEKKANVRAVGMAIAQTICVARFGMYRVPLSSPAAFNLVSRGNSAPLIGH